MISLVVGGKSGIGRSIVEVLRDRGDKVYTFSRRKSKDENHISFDLSSKASIKKIENLLGNIFIDNLIFCHRYRGDDRKKEYEITVGAVCEVIEILRSEDKVKVKGMNMVKKHEKTTKEKKGGIISKENFMHISNLKNLETKEGKKKIKESKK